MDKGLVGLLLRSPADIADKPLFSIAEIGQLNLPMAKHWHEIQFKHNDPLEYAGRADINEQMQHTDQLRIQSARCARDKIYRTRQGRELDDTIVFAITKDRHC